MFANGRFLSLSSRRLDLLPPIAIVKMMVSRRGNGPQLIPPKAKRAEVASFADAVNQEKLMFEIKLGTGYCNSNK